MDILVVTAHTDDFIYGLAGTLLLHAEDRKHIVAVSSIQQSAAREVAAELNATIEFLGAPYHRISDHAQRVKEALAEILRSRRPSYIFGPPASGDWTADHTAVGRALLDACDLANVFAHRCRLLRYPIASTTLQFEPNIWIDLPPMLLDKKLELAQTMTRGLEGEWPGELVAWEVGQGLRYALDVGWPTRHAEAFDALFAVPFRRLPPPEQLPGEPWRGSSKVDELVAGKDLSAGPSDLVREE